MTSSKGPSHLPCKAQGAYFQTTVNKTGDNYIELMVGGMISHEKDNTDNMEQMQREVTL